jgi:hypothetical protein
MTGPVFTWGDTNEVQSLADPADWTRASVCGLPDDRQPAPTYLVEYGDGSDEQVAANRLRRLPG